MAEPNKSFVVGWPIHHSRSPLIHNHWIEEYQLQGSYEKQAIEPDNFEVFIKNLPVSDFRGGNVTIPHKEAAFKAVDKADPIAERLGAVNTVWVEDGKITGANTDGHGFLANLDDRSPGWDNEAARQKGALVLGAGGASRAIIDALIQRGFENITIANRTVERAETLVAQFGATCRAVGIKDVSPKNLSPSLIVNTTAIGMNDGEQPISLVGFDRETVVNDIVYTPLKTPLLKEAEELGMQAVDGLGMLLHQAVPGFEKWYGVRPVVTDAVRNIILKDLGELT